MEEFLKGTIIGMVAGICVGACIVAKNKKLASKLKSGMVTAEEKFKEIKEDFKDKLDKDCEPCDCGCIEGENNQNCGYEQEQKDFSKKNKN